MNLSMVLRKSTMWLAVCGMVLPTSAFGANLGGNSPSVIQDVALGPDATLRGTVVDANGNQSSNTPIQFHRDGHLIAQAVTDANGHFVARKLTGGVYAVQTPGNVEHFRVWSNQAAPPSALGNLNISGGEIIRGQHGAVPHMGGPHGGRGPGGMMARPWLIGIGVAAAIAIPLAVDDSNRRPAS